MRTALAVVLLTILSGCQTATDHRAAVRDPSEQKLTLGTAQREIRNGMSQAEVAKALGSPNMVTRDRSGIETWIYDKISTEYFYSTSSGGVVGLIIGSTGNVGGGAIGSTTQSSGANTRTQRTLTIIIKFKDGQVDEFTYNATSF